MFSLTKAEAAQILPQLELLWLETAKRRRCGTQADIRPGHPSPRRRDGSLTVLVVDDDDDIRDYAAAVLRGAGYRVFAAASPREALRQLGQAPAIDLMFTDIVLPDIDGFELAELAKRRHPALQVLYTSGYAETFERQPVERYGRLLAKPYRSAQLEQAVGEATARGSEVPFR
jgi:CheY-like chemotaxis protein